VWKGVLEYCDCNDYLLFVVRSATFGRIVVDNELTKTFMIGTVPKNNIKVHFLIGRLSRQGPRES